MKKLAIAGASVALAAMPVVSTFAVTTPSVTDTIQLTVNKTCEMSASAATKTVELGNAVAGSEYAEKEGSAMTVVCNSIKGWTIKATATALTDAADPDTTSQTIPFGAYGTTSSVWSAKVTPSGNDQANASVTSSWTDWTVAAASNATVVSSIADTTGHKAVNGFTITPSYKAYAQANQASATYSGTMTYTFAENAS